LIYRNARGSHTINFLCEAFASGVSRRTRLHSPPRSALLAVISEDTIIHWRDQTPYFQDGVADRNVPVIADISQRWTGMIEIHNANHVLPEPIA